MTASAFTHDHDIIIIKGTESLKIFWYEEVAGRWIGKFANIILFTEKSSQVFRSTEIGSPCFFFSTLFHSKF